MDFRKIAREVLDIEADALLKADVSGIEKAVEIAYNTKGKLIVTGVGKSGLIGSKIAATLASTGTPSFFIHPTEALHGDLGMITKDDSVLAISYSGESEELIKILPHIKRFEVPLIAMTGRMDSTLARYADVVLNIHVDKEACPLNVAPTSSTTLTLAMGDALAVCLMKKRNFTKEDFASFHPGGSLGKKLFVKVKDLMKEEFPVVDEDVSLKDAIIKMTEGKLGHVLFLDNGKVKAILSDGDLRRAMMSENFDLNKKAIEFATLNPKTINKEMLASDALAFMEDNKIQFLPVIDNNGNVVGVIHIHHLVEAGIK
ncbi:KpsF/GutQ family sugar-phosphate isomerase [Caminibacter pacificus]|uniref:Arabinose-5-phosphate isomerase n=1 Tax=Caminibacter pacificus TaxID=1424653 RepID=A0AAJ4RD71_9BACT|nr:KpsF/GutQ family sugar-phosphate isomerase [Caminibacter pacificus]NPA87307.1 KpsF/GutQ family sugar-phosphate isomerase [Campylobacterota bacterium]QCI27549.1 KpsF/GutQ family sugar-phosphate isomerase [Caminibacter pacificus]ROR40273.1 arabinose-5-phosphate isomerase [Caminibacter pacificus]